MGISKRGKSWQISFRIGGGKRVTKTFRGTEREARAEEARMRILMPLFGIKKRAPLPTFGAYAEALLTGAEHGRPLAAR